MPINDYHQEYGPIRRRQAQGGMPAPEEPPPRNEPPRPQRPQQRRCTRPQRRRGCGGPLLLLLLLLLAAPLILPYGLSFAFANQALPGISIQGEPVAGMSRAAINAQLAERYDSFMRNPVALVYADQVWQPSLSDLGVRLDLDAAAHAAVTTGRRGDPLMRLQELYLIYQQGLELAPRLVVDQQVLQDYLLSLAPPIETPPQNAALSLTAAHVLGTPGQPGKQLLVDATANDLMLALRDLRPKQVAVRTRLLEPSVSDAALAVAEERAKALLQAPIQMQRGDEVWLWEPERLAELLHVAVVDDRLELYTDVERLTRAVEGLAQLVDSGTAEPRLRFVAGTVQIVEPGQPGWRLRQEDALEQLANLLLSTSATTRTLELPGDVLEPQITAERIDSLGIRALVAEGRSSFSGSAAYRITNIEAGAQRMDGVLIAPGEEFSFNRQLGEVNAANGFVEGYAIIGNRTQLEWGGGVCQVSTTVFRSAFWAGLPITERHAHAFYISWYDPFGLGPYGDGQGLDAAIYTGVADLKFVNDTGHWLLMHAEVDAAAQILNVRLYGTPPDRQVSIEGPLISNEVRAPAQPIYVDDPSLPRGTLRQSDVARSGRDITIHRIIRQGEHELARQTFLTRFRAWPNIFVRGTGV
ncbi:VanW family protein [Candidatus Viridilinea mediisalina]|uniref:Vanomycin resistance protein VanB n=1 Tax=Candidatus Viridilinea mediisalina TaxID=2024553 RepID=A0A2A6RLX9_9CHLR|nr:VanW family protein [Candidatus Viridilinea mediisalina]PDW03878.1 vanomycin resistance protein VanB [Candidatus Viridilinea mediisalina]